MNKVNIIVLGHGLIPRGLGIAPKKDPFPADIDLVKLILAGGQRVVAIHPITKGKIEITYNNLNKMWKILTTAGKTVQPSVAQRFTSEQEKKEIGNVINKAAEATKPVTPVNEVKATPVVEKVEAKPVDNNKKEEEKKDSSNNNDKKDEKKDNKDNKGGFKPINNPNNK